MSKTPIVLCTSRVVYCIYLGFTPPKNNMTMENPPFQDVFPIATWGFSNVMLVFRGIPPPHSGCNRGKCSSRFPHPTNVSMSSWWLTILVSMASWGNSRSPSYIPPPRSLLEVDLGRFSGASYWVEISNWRKKLSKMPASNEWRVSLFISKMQIF